MGAKYTYDEEKAGKVFAFVEKFIRHVEGEWAGKPMLLEDWQKHDILGPLFATVHKETGLRRYRRAYIEIPRKNGKSTLAAIIVIVMLMLDNEPGAQVFSLGGSRDQARIVFRMVRLMLEAHPALLKRVSIYQNAILHGNSYYKALSKESGTQHGLNAHCTIVDEYHVHKSADLRDTHATSMGTRRQPLLLHITTAGNNESMACREEHDYAKSVLNGQVKDESYLPVIYGASEDDDPLDIETAKKANPNFGVSVKPEFIKQEIERAKTSPAYLNTYRQLHLNQWVGASAGWIAGHVWKAAGHPIDEESLKGRKCYLGLDLGRKSDASALCLLFPDGDGFISINKFWLPEVQAAENMRDYNRYYAGWVVDGYIVETPGEVTDQTFIMADILRIYKDYDVQVLAYDSYAATELMANLQREGIDNVAPVLTRAKELAEVVEKMHNLVTNDKFNHGGNPVLAWMVDNTLMRRDAAGNELPDKGKGRHKIDGVIANLYSLYAAMEANKSDDEDTYLSNDEMILL